MSVELSERSAHSFEVNVLRALRDEWAALDSGAARTARFESSARTLATRTIAHRARLFAENARVLADAESPDDPGVASRTDANEDAIKACTTILTEIGAALGDSSVAG